MVDYTGLLAMFPSPCGLPPSGPDFRYTNFSSGRSFPHFTYTHFSGCRHRRSLATQTFQVAVTVAFYLHKLFGLRSPLQLHFSYTNFSGGKDFAYYLHTLSGRFLSKIAKIMCEKNNVNLEKIPRGARPSS